MDSKQHSSHWTCEHGVTYTGSDDFISGARNAHSEGVKKYAYAAAHGEERSFNDIAQDIIDAAPQVEPLVEEWFVTLSAVSRCSLTTSRWPLLQLRSRSRDGLRIERLEADVVKQHEERVEHLRRVQEIDSYLVLVGNELRDLREARSAVASNPASSPLDPAGYIELDERGNCPHGVHKGLGCRVCDPASSPESPCSICRSYGHFTHNHPEGYVNPMYDALDPASVPEGDHDAGHSAQAGQTVQVAPSGTLASNQESEHRA